MTDQPSAEALKFIMTRAGCKERCVDKTCDCVSAALDCDAFAAQAVAASRQPRIDHDELVAILMMAEDAGADPEYVLKNQRAIVAQVRAGAVHDGDCTNQAHTCFVCLVEHYDETARAAAPFLDTASERAKPLPVSIPLSLGCIQDGECRQSPCICAQSAAVERASLASQVEHSTHVASHDGDVLQDNAASERAKPDASDLERLRPLADCLVANKRIPLTPEAEGR